MPILVIYTIIWMKYTHSMGLVIEKSMGGLIGYYTVIGIPYLCCTLYLGSEFIDIVGDFCGQVFYPTKKFKTMAPQYSIPSSLEKSGEYEKAISVYEEIIAEFPNEYLPYIRMMEITRLKLNDCHRTTQIFDKACLLFSDNKDILDKIIHQYELCDKLKLKEENDILNYEKEIEL